MQPTSVGYTLPTCPGKLPLLTKKKVRAIERSHLLFPSEKVRLLAILAHFRWITEIKGNGGQGTEERVGQLGTLLDELGFAFAVCRRQMKNGGSARWIQVAANQPLLRHVLSRELTVIEAGILYGYPPSSILAFVGIIEKHPRPRKGYAEHYLSGVFSELLLREERRHFVHTWEALRKVSPSIIAEAENTLGS